MKRIGLIVIILIGLALVVWSHRQYPAVFAPLEAEIDQLTRVNPFNAFGR